MNVKIELGLDFVIDNSCADCSSAPKKLKGERMYSSWMNLVVSR